MIKNHSKQVINKERRSLLKDIIYGTLLSVGLLSVAGLTLAITYLLASAFNQYWLMSFLYLLHPINQGLNDHIAFSSTLLFTLSSFSLGFAFLIPRIRRLFTRRSPWIIVSGMGVGIGLMMLLDMRFNADYQLYRSIDVVLVVQVMTIIAVFLFHWIRNDDNVKRGHRIE